MTAQMPVALLRVAQAQQTTSGWTGAHPPLARLQSTQKLFWRSSGANKAGGEETDCQEWIDCLLLA